MEPIFRFPGGTSKVALLRLDGTLNRSGSLLPMYPSVSRVWHRRLGYLEDTLADIVEPHHPRVFNVTAIPVLVWQDGDMKHRPHLEWLSVGAGILGQMTRVYAEDYGLDGPLVVQVKCTLPGWQRLELQPCKSPYNGMTPEMAVAAKEFVTTPPALVNFADTPETRARLAALAKCAEAVTAAEAGLDEAKKAYESSIEDILDAKAVSLAAPSP